MIRLAAALVVLVALPQAEDTRKRVKELIEQLQADEIQTVEDAQAALVTLGPSAAEAIREAARAASGDTKLRLEEALRKIERNMKRSRALGTPVLVTLKAKDKLLADILEEIKKATAQPLVFNDLPADKVTIDFDKVGFWEAIDRLCKTHGGVMWEAKEKEIILSKRPYRDLPKVFRGNQIVFFERLTSDQRLQGARSHPYLSLEGGFAWTKGSIVPKDTLVLDEFKDDQGTDLKAKPAGFGATFTLNEDESVDPESIVKSLYFSESNLLDDKAKSIAQLKGSLRLEYILESRKIATFEKPAGMVGKPVKAGNLTVTIKRWNFSDGDLDARISVQAATARDKLPVRASGFRLIDSKGVARPANGWVDEDVDEDTGKIEYEVDLESSLGEGIQIASLEFTVPVDIEEVVIPFDFKGLPLK